MPAQTINLDKVALIAELVEQAPRPLGRTAVMKLVYFLKALKKVPVRYSFSLYTYGPFDSDVLDDLRYAEALRAVKSSLVAYPGGHGYQYKAGPEIDQIRKLAKRFLDRQQENIKWVLSEFGSRSAGDLEMASTLIFVDREAAARHSQLGLRQLAEKVRAIKPYLSADAIELEARSLANKGLLAAAV